MVPVVVMVNCGGSGGGGVLLVIQGHFKFTKTPEPVDLKV